MKYCMFRVLANHEHTGNINACITNYNAIKSILLTIIIILYDITSYAIYSLKLIENNDNIQFHPLQATETMMCYYGGTNKGVSTQSRVT